MDYNSQRGAGRRREAPPKRVVCGEISPENAQRPSFRSAGLADQSSHRQPYDDDIILLQKEINSTCYPYGPSGSDAKHTEDRAGPANCQRAGAAPRAPAARPAKIPAILNKRGPVEGGAGHGDGDLGSATSRSGT